MINKFIKEKNVNYQLTNILTAFIECTQNTILVWLVYKYTYSSIAISLMTFANYFPMVISIFTFISIADNINPLYQYCFNNFLFFFISILTLLLFIIKPNINLFLILIFILQISISFIRTLHKTNFSKITKILFEVSENERDKILKMSLSIIQIFQTVGNILGNLFIIFNVPKLGLSFTCLIYIINFYLSYLLLFNYNYLFINNISLKSKKRFIWSLNLLIDLFNNKKLLGILLFSIPSSGFFQYLMSMLPFLTKIFYIHLNSNYSYSILNFCCTFLASIIGFILYNEFCFNLVQNYTFLICSFILFLLSINNNFIILLFLSSICFGLLAGHIICMQVQINKYSTYVDLGKYTLLRNSVASLSKIIFSLLSIYFINNCSLFFVYIFAASCLLLFHFLNYLYNYFYLFGYF